MEGSRGPQLFVSHSANTAGYVKVLQQKVFGSEDGIFLEDNSTHISLPSSTSSDDDCSKTLITFQLILRRLSLEHARARSRSHAHARSPSDDVTLYSRERERLHT